MKIFDENGNYLGEFFEDTKEKVEDAFEGSWLFGIIFLFFIAPWWTLFGLVVWGICKILKFVIVLLFKLAVLFLRCLWWLIRLPFCLIFLHEKPKF